MANRKEVFQKLKQAGKLPTPSKTALEVTRLCRDESSSLGDIAQVIKLDPSLSAELLRYANSAFLSTGIQVASIEKATVKLGMKTIVNLILGLSLLSNNKKGQCRNFNYNRFWSLSLAQAIAAKTIAELGKDYDPKEMFLCSLLAHIGELGLASVYPEEYATILDGQPERSVRCSLEREQFGIDSAELTTDLFLDWGLPSVYAIAAGFHEELTTADLGASTTKKTAELLNLAFRIALLSHGLEPSTQWLDTTEEMAAEYHDGQQSFEELFDMIVNTWHAWGIAFGIATKECPYYKDIKARSEKAP